MVTSITAHAREPEFTDTSPFPPLQTGDAPARARVESSPVLMSQGGRRGVGLADLKKAWSAAGMSAGAIRAIEADLEAAAKQPHPRFGRGIQHPLAEREFNAMQDTYLRAFAPELDRTVDNCTFYVNYVLLQNGVEPLGEPGGPGRSMRNYGSVLRAYQAALERGATRVTNLADIQPGDLAFLMATKRNGSGVSATPLHAWITVSADGRPILTGQSDRIIQFRDPRSKMIKELMRDGELHILRLPR